MVNTNYHKSINKTLIARNYFDDFFKGLLLRNSHPKHPRFAISILRNFWKNMINTWSTWSIINKVIHSTVAVMRNRARQHEYSFGHAKPSMAIGSRVRTYGL
jgi:hypothetical protein